MVCLRLSLGGIQLKLHKEERFWFGIAQRHLASVPLICALHNTHGAAKNIKKR